MSHNEPLDNPLVDEELQKDLPFANSALNLGILSIVFTLVIIGVLLAFMAIAQSNHALNEYDYQPQKYTLKSYKKAIAGRLCGIIALALFFISLLLFFAFTVFLRE